MTAACACPLPNGCAAQQLTQRRVRLRETEARVGRPQSVPTQDRREGRDGGRSGLREWIDRLRSLEDALGEYQQPWARSGLRRASGCLRTRPCVRAIAVGKTTAFARIDCTRRSRRRSRRPPLLMHNSPCLIRRLAQRSRRCQRRLREVEGRFERIQREQQEAAQTLGGRKSASD